MDGEGKMVFHLSQAPSFRDLKKIEPRRGPEPPGTAPGVAITGFGKRTRRSSARQITVAW